jgi:hypothetical protein
MRLLEHPDELAVLVGRATAERGLPVPFAEKDFWVTEVLRAASAPREVTMPDGIKPPGSL